jgi:hypothetical protein
MFVVVVDDLFFNRGLQSGNIYFIYLFYKSYKPYTTNVEPQLALTATLVSSLSLDFYLHSLIRDNPQSE